jgi:surface polysaccharide O-acyltransferase-like enzyme
MSNKKQRESNIELLRILSMLIIVIYHFLIHSIIPNSPELNYITKPLITVLHIGVICFVLISGYWGIKFSLKSFTKIFFYCSFYSILIYIFGVLLNPELFSIKNSIKSLIPIQWWFIPVYLCLFLLTPIINTQLKTANKSTKIFTIILLIIISFGFGQFVPSLSGGKNPINFILIYYLGNYLRTELNTDKLNIKKIIFLYLGCNIILFSIIFLAEILFPAANKIINPLFFPYNSIGLIINSILFFLIFTKLTFSSKLVNWLASSSLAVYLIHENKYIGHYLHNYVNYLQNHIDNGILFSLSIILFGILIFILAVSIDKLISPLFQLIINQITSLKIFMKINNKVQRILEEK